MINFLSNLLNIRRGERKRLLIFYVMLFLFSNGITWGGSVVEAVFMNQSGLGVGALPLIIIADAVVSVVAIIIYTAFVDRIPNDYLMIGLLAGFIASIGAGHALITAGQISVAYTLLFVVSRASDSIFLLHWWTYVSEYYDIRAFKRVAPVILSAKTLGLLTSGMTLPLLTGILRPPDIVLIWMCALALMIVPVRLMPRLLREPRQRASARRSLQRESFIASMQEGYHYVRRSDYLRWFAVASLALAIAAALFQSLSSHVIQTTFPDETGYANFLGVMNIVGGVLTFPLQLFLMNRIINRIGVGSAMMLYPLSTVISSAALLFLPPQVLNAALGVLNRSVFRLAFRAPIMGLVYNVVPTRVRGRTRAFVSGLVEPVGAVLGSLLLLAIPALRIPNLLAFALMALIALYGFGTLRTRHLYSATLVETLQSEEYSALFDSDDLLAVSDPQTLNRLKTQLLASDNVDNTFFLSRLLAESGGKDAVPILKQVLETYTGDEAHDTATRLAVLNALVMTQATTPDVIALFLPFITHPDERLRQAAVDGLEEIQVFTPDQDTLLHDRMLVETSPALQARLIPVVMRSSDPAHTETAHTSLHKLLTNSDPEQVLIGLQVVTQIREREGRYLPLLITLAESEHDEVRLAAVRALEALIQQGVPSELTILQLDQLQNDPVERIRELALAIIRYSDDPEQHTLILGGLKDPSRTVRQTAARLLVEMGKEIISMLIATIESEETDTMVRKMTTVALAQLQPRRHTHQIEGYILDDLSEIYQNNRQLAALVDYQTSQGIRILQTTLQEQNAQYLDDIFYLLTAISRPVTVATIREALESDSGAIKASGIEALESLISADTARWISARFDSKAAASFMLEMQDKIDIPAALSTREALQQLCADPDDSWLRAAAIYGLGEINGVFSPKEREALFTQALADPYADVRQAARAARRRVQANGHAQEQQMAMLSQIERIMFLKQVALFQSIPLEQLKALAAVCEPEAFPAKVTIFQQGEASGGLYVVTAGQVAIQVRGHATSTIQLATLGVNAYFGEMSLFNNRSRSASAITLQETEVLRLSRTSFIRLVRQFPDMSLTLLDVLSQRLTELNEQLAGKQA